MSVADKYTILTAEKIPAVFNAGQDIGYRFGYEQGHGAGYDVGLQTEYDRFWNTYQNNGERTSYGYAFGGNGWTDETFKPKYDVKVVGAAPYLFGSTKIKNLAKALEDAGVTLDTSEMTAANNTFSASSSIEEIPVLDFSSCTELRSTFYWCQRLHTLGLVLGNPKTTFTDAFYRCDKLQNITITGEIFNNISFANSSLLTGASLNAIVSCLSGEVTGKTATFSKAAVDREFETEPGANDGSTNPNSYWQIITGYIPNWTVSLV